MKTCRGASRHTFLNLKGTVSGGETQAWRRQAIFPAPLAQPLLSLTQSGFFGFFWLFVFLISDPSES